MPPLNDDVMLPKTHRMTLGNELGSAVLAMLGVEGRRVRSINIELKAGDMATITVRWSMTVSQEDDLIRTFRGIEWREVPPDAT